MSSILAASSPDPHCGSSKQKHYRTGARCRRSGMTHAGSQLSLRARLSCRDKAAKIRAAVDRFHAAGLAAGGRDNSAPGERAYHPGYYSTFLLDPEGNYVEAVCHGAVQRSAEAIEVKAV